MKVRALAPVIAFGIIGGLAFAGCGSNGGSGAAGDVGTYVDSGSFGAGDASAAGPLDASIEQNGMQVNFITLSCAGDCASVEAVATGGHPPYTFAWDDGSTSPMRTVCPTSTTSYFVEATDTATTGEVPRAAETVKVPLAASVLACPDGGPTGTGCETILSASLSGVTGPGAQSCPTDAASNAAFGTTVALQAGQEYELVQNAMGTLFGGSDPIWQFYAASTDCNTPGAGQLLGSLTFDPTIPRASICFRAGADYDHLDWYSTNAEEAAGLISSSYQLCHGCGQDASP